MSIKIYEYKNCSTCKKAMKYLDSKKINYTRVPIVEQPPTLAELKLMLTYLKTAGGSFKSLFNTSGVQYRELKIADKIAKGLTEAEALKLLSQNGKLVKRPFLLLEKAGVVGFKQEIWTKLF